MARVVVEISGGVKILSVEEVYWLENRFATLFIISFVVLLDGSTI